VLEGRCLPYGDGITYWPLVEIVRASAGIADDDRAEVARGRIDRLLGDAPGAEKIATGIAQVVGLEGGQASENEVFSAVRGFLRSLAGDRPLVVVFEDVHWAEPTLLDLIDDIVAAGGEAAILLVALARPDLLDRRLEWTGRPESRSLVLETLPSDDADRLLAGLLPGAALPDPLRAVLETAGEGNPLFLEELVGMLVDDGRLRRAGDEWVVAGKIEDLRIPPTINALLGARLDGLAPEVRAVAGRASVIGRVFDRDALVAVSPDGEREATPGSLTVLASAELVEPVPGGPGATFQFRHVLIRDAAYWSLPKATRADLHERLAGWIERSSGDRLGEVEEIVGYHFEAAHRWRSDLGTLGDGGDELAAQAAEHLAAASRRAVARSDSRAAANLLTRTAALLRPDDPARGPLLIDLGLALLNIGESLRADAALDEVEALADASGDRLMRAHAVVQRWLGSDGTHGRMAEARPDALDALARFEAAGDELGQARAWRLLSEIEWAEGHGAASEAANTNDLAHARRSGRPREATEAYCILSGILNTGPISVADGIAHAEAILEREAGNGPVEGWLCHGLAHLRARRGEFAEARALAARSDASLLRHGQSYEAAIQSELWGDLELLAGDAPAAVLVLKAGFEITERSGRPSLMLAAFLSQAAVAANQPAEAEAAADQAIAGGGWIRAIAQGALGRVRAGQGRLAEAELLTAEAVAYFEQTDFLTFRARACLDRADVLRRSGRWADAVAAATLARELHRRKGSDLEADRAELVLRELESAAAEVRAPAG
ncbi:MAG TPA: hypothetical protein VLR93_08155, partial [Patescibacteria group bacterium]|nr:hypothetical protein [Patescibacteria group bacterium]